MSNENELHAKRNEIEQAFCKINKTSINLDDYIVSKANNLVSNLKDPEEKEGLIIEKMVDKMYPISRDYYFDIFTGLLMEQPSADQIALGKLLRFMRAIPEKRVEQNKELAIFVIKNTCKDEEGLTFLGDELDIRDGFDKIKKRQSKYINERIKLANRYPKAREYYLTQMSKDINDLKVKFRYLFEEYSKTNNDLSKAPAWFAKRYRKDANFQTEFGLFLYDTDILTLLKDKDTKTLTLEKLQ